VDVRIQNTTTSTEFATTRVIRLVELGDRGATLEVAPRCCAQGHSLMLDFRASKNGNVLAEFLTTAKVDEQSRQDGDVDRIALTFVQYEEESWRQFRSTFTLRQDQINQFLKGARGW
jgi:hypothetical protein